ncbi:MAG TPA: twin-arginine translocase subunit TatC [Solirubrobacterales bacterium]|nr:twin-arginine translocase subunit TatC [Solirubrobacterales bacterium]
MSAQDLRRRRLRWLRFRRRRQKSTTMTVMEHLGELRTRLIISAAAFAVAAVAVFMVYEPILETLRQPLCSLDRDLLGELGCKLQTFKPTEGLLIRLKIASMGGMIAASPIWLYQIWAFVTPGLTMREKRYAAPFIFSAVFLFAAGTAFAYYMLPNALRFLVTIAGSSIDVNFRAEEYLNFVGLILIAFGITFQLPLLLFFLGLANVVNVDQLRRYRRYAIVGIAVLGALVTPTQDPFTMMALSVPLYALYELVIVLLAAVKRRKRKESSV